MLTYVWPAAIILLIASPLVLWTRNSSIYDPRSFLITACVGGLGIVAPLMGLGQALVMWKLLLAQTLMFASFASISWVRQRRSLSFIGFVSIFSNGGWFVAMQMLSASYIISRGPVWSADVLGALVMVVTGTLVGRLVAVQWTRWAGAKWGVKTTEVRSSTVRAMDQMAVIVCAAALFICLDVYGIGQLTSMFDVCVVMTLGILQNTIYTVNSRFANRDHPGWPILTGLVTGATMYGQWLFLAGHTYTGGAMPLLLLVPYTVATVSGTVIGSKISMGAEERLKLQVTSADHRPDYSSVKWHYWFLAILALLSALYAFNSEQVLGVLGWQAHPVDLSALGLGGIRYERPVFLFLAGLPFFIQNFTHTLSSRAGSRSNSRVHAVMCIIHGIVYFCSLMFVIVNVKVLDFLPFAVLGGMLGQFFAQILSGKFEWALKSFMDETSAAAPKQQVA